MLSLDDLCDQLERSLGLLTQNFPALTSELAEATEILLVVVLELLRKPLVGTIDHESIWGTSYVFSVATATATVSSAAGFTVAEEDVDSGTVIDDFLNTRMEALDCICTIVRSLRCRVSTFARGHSRWAHMATHNWCVFCAKNGLCVNGMGGTDDGTGTSANSGTKGCFKPQNKRALMGAWRG